MKRLLKEYTVKELKKKADGAGITGARSNKKQLWAKQMIDGEAEISAEDSASKHEILENQKVSQDHSRNRNEPNDQNRNRNDRNECNMPNVRNQNENENDNENDNDHKQGNKDDEPSSVKVNVNCDVSVEGMEAYITAGKWMHMILKNKQIISNVLKPKLPTMSLDDDFKVSFRAKCHFQLTACN